MGQITIVLAENHSLVREGTRRILEEFPDLKVVGEAADGKKALDLVSQLHPNIVISDVQMPVLNGVELTRTIRERFPETRVLTLMGEADDERLLALMQAGASGYLLKTVQARELVESVRNVHRGETVIYPPVAARVARLWAGQRHPDNGRNGNGLSAREREVLHLAARGMRNKSISSQLGISVRTVEGHFSSIFNKLGVSSRTEAVLHALSHHMVSTNDDDHSH
ncbi:MAG: response regulator transcription factor [Chloroflexi bacterium]|nr:response regulator transcription factor [Chloroflexota bacterium]